MPKRPPNLWQDPRSGVWYARTYKADGTDGPRRSLRTRDFKEACRIAPGVAEQIKRSNPGGSAGRRLWIVLAAAEIAERKTLRKPSAEHLAILELKWAKVIIPNIPEDVGPDVFGTEDALRYIARRREAGVRGQTIYRETSSIWNAMVIGKRRGHRFDLPDDWPEVGRDPKDQRKSGKRWDPALVREWLMHQHQDSRDETIVAAVTMVRATELKRVRPEYLKPAPHGAATKWVIDIPPDATKSKKQGRTLGLPDIAYRIVKRRIEANPEADFVFAQKSFRKHREAISEDLNFTCNLTLRDLRHTFSTEVLHLTNDATGVMRAMGHSDLQMTVNYQSTTPERAATIGAAAERVLLGEVHPDDLTRMCEKRRSRKLAKSLVGAAGFELATPSSQTQRISDSASNIKEMRAPRGPKNPGKRGPIVTHPDELPGCVSCPARGVR